MEGSSAPDLLGVAAQVGERLRARGETVAVAESSAGGLISSALLAVPGASDFSAGGAIVYTRAAKTAFLRLDEAALSEPRPATEGHARVLARAVREVLGATWGIGETGAAGPTGNRYGDAPGSGAVAVAGPRERADTVETGHGDRATNMETFAWLALCLLRDLLTRD